MVVKSVNVIDSCWLKILSMNTKKFLKNWLPLFLWMSLIFLFSSRSSSELPNAGQWDLLLKKGAHFVAYGILAILAYRAVKGRKRPFFTALLLSVLYAISDEFHQTFVPGRNGTLIDVLLDSSGALFGLWLFTWNKLNPKWMKPATSASDQP